MTTDTPQFRDWKIIVIAFLLGSSGGGLGHGILNGDEEATSRLETKIDGLAAEVHTLNGRLGRIDRRIDTVETYQNYRVKPVVEASRYGRD